MLGASEDRSGYGVGAGTGAGARRFGLRSVDDHHSLNVVSAGLELEGRPRAGTGLVAGVLRRAPAERGDEVTVLPARRLLVVESESDLQRDLDVRDRALVQLTANLDDLEPVEVPRRPRGSIHGVADGGVHAVRRRSDHLLAAEPRRVGPGLRPSPSTLSRTLDR